MTMRDKMAAKHNPFKTATAWALAGFTIGAEGSNIITVAIQLYDANRREVAQRCHFEFYLSDDANGDSILATGVTSLAAGTDGLYEARVSNKSGAMVSESDGDADLAIEFTGGAKTVYLILKAPDGSLIASSAITFA